MNITSLFLFKRSNGFWYVVFKEGGRIRWKSTKARKKREALLFLTEFKEALQPKPRRILFSQFVKEFEEIAGPNLRESTLKGIYGVAFRDFLALCGNRDLSWYTARDVDLFKAKRLKTCSPTTVHIQFRTLKAAFNCAVRWGLLKENPFANCKPPRIPERRPTYVNEDEFKRLLDVTVEILFKRLFEFAVLTGMRLGEILNLEWSDVELDRKLISVSNSETFLTKTGKMRVVPMSDRVRDVLEEIKNEGKDSKYVFQYSLHKINKSHVDHKFREYRRAANLEEDITFHSLRHTFATWLVQKGVSIFEVQKLLGHSDIKVTQVYSHLASNELHEAVNKIRV